MPRDTTWEDVWAEYDARQARHDDASEALAPAAEAVPLPPSHRRRQPGTLVLGGLMALLVVLLGLPFGDAGAPAVASQEQPFQRHTMIVAGVAGEAEMGESPASAPPEAVLLAEAALLPMPPPAWVQPNQAGAIAPPNQATANPAPALAAPPPVAEPRRHTRTPRRLARPPQRQLAAAGTTEQTWFDGSTSLQHDRLAVPPLGTTPPPSSQRRTGGRAGTPGTSWMSPS